MCRERIAFWRQPPREVNGSRHLKHILLFHVCALGYNAAMLITLLKHVLHGMALPVEVMNSPLYRYPYRQAGEALRGDWLKIGGDVEYVINRENSRE